MIDMVVQDEIPDGMMIIGDFTAMKAALFKEGFTLLDVDKLTPEQVARLIIPYAKVVKFDD